VPSRKPPTSARLSAADDVDGAMIGGTCATHARACGSHTRARHAHARAQHCAHPRKHARARAQPHGDTQWQACARVRAQRREHESVTAQRSRAQWAERTSSVATAAKTMPAAATAGTGPCHRPRPQGSRASRYSRSLPSEGCGPGQAGGSPEAAKGAA
jgi:hypothetical protein